MFILKFLSILIVGGILSVAVTMLSTQATLTSSFEGSKLVIEQTSMAILPSVIITNVITTIVVCGFAVIVTLLVSHKIAGPMFRFEKDLEEIAQGDLQKTIKIRDGDQFENVAINLNEMVSKLNGKLSEVQQELDRLAVTAETENLPQKYRDELESCRNKIDANFKLN